MLDLHTHSILSDGELLPSELARRYEEKGFEAVAITDHADLSNIKALVEAITGFCRKWPKDRIKVLPGIELTHLPLDQFRPAVVYARKKGIRVIVAHGETLVEPVIDGTAMAALQAGIDILSHPGLISEENVKLAARRGVFLEVSTRKGHCLGNGHVVDLARRFGARLCVNSDSHAPADIPTPGFLKKVALGAGLDEKGFAQLQSRLKASFLE